MPHTQRRLGQTISSPGELGQMPANAENPASLSCLPPSTPIGSAFQVDLSPSNFGTSAFDGARSRHVIRASLSLAGWHPEVPDKPGLKPLRAGPSES